MKIVILAGGLGTRLGDITEVRPKPMVEIGRHPIIWHIMKHCASYGFNEFYVALGYKGDVIKRYFMDYYAMNSDVVVDLKQGDLQILQRHREDWRVHLIDTGLQTLTGGRLKRMLPHLGDETFMLTYGDGVCNVNLHDLLTCHQQKQALATVTAVRPSARFGNLVLDNDRVTRFTEKNQIGAGWINGGFIMMQPQIDQYLPDEDVSLEQHTLEALASDGKLAAFCHEGFWQCMDTKREVDLLNRLWEQPDCPWRNWRE